MRRLYHTVPCHALRGAPSSHLLDRDSSFPAASSSSSSTSLPVAETSVCALAALLHGTHVRFCSSSSSPGCHPFAPVSSVRAGRRLSKSGGAGCARNKNKTKRLKGASYTVTEDRLNKEHTSHHPIDRVHPTTREEDCVSHANDHDPDGNSPAMHPSTRAAHDMRSTGHDAETCMPSPRVSYMRGGGGVGFGSAPVSHSAQPLPEQRASRARRSSTRGSTPATSASDESCCSASLLGRAKSARTSVRVRQRVRQASLTKTAQALHHYDTHGSRRDPATTSALHFTRATSKASLDKHALHHSAAENTVLVATKTRSGATRSNEAKTTTAGKTLLRRGPREERAQARLRSLLQRLYTQAHSWAVQVKQWATAPSPRVLQHLEEELRVAIRDNSLSALANLATEMQRRYEDAMSSSRECTSFLLLYARMLTNYGACCLVNFATDRAIELLQRAIAMVEQADALHRAQQLSSSSSGAAVPSMGGHEGDASATAPRVAGSDTTSQVSRFPPHTSNMNTTTSHDEKTSHSTQKDGDGNDAVNTHGTATGRVKPAVSSFAETAVLYIRILLANALAVEQQAWQAAGQLQRVQQTRDRYPCCTLYQLTPGPSGMQRLCDAFVEEEMRIFFGTPPTRGVETFAAVSAASPSDRHRSNRHISAQGGRRRSHHRMPKMTAMSKSGRGETTSLVRHAITQGKAQLLLTQSQGGGVAEQMSIQLGLARLCHRGGAYAESRGWYEAYLDALVQHDLEDEHGVMLELGRMLCFDADETETGLVYLEPAADLCCEDAEVVLESRSNHSHHHDKDTSNDRCPARRQMMNTSVSHVDKDAKGDDSLVVSRALPATESSVVIRAAAALLDTALMHHICHRPDRARSLLKGCISLLERGELAHMACWAMLQYADILCTLCCVDQAVEMYTHAMRVLRRNSDRMVHCSTASSSDGSTTSATHNDVTEYVHGCNRGLPHEKEGLPAVWQLATRQRMVPLQSAEAEAHLAYCMQVYVGDYRRAHFHYQRAVEAVSVGGGSSRARREDESVVTHASATTSATALHGGVRRRTRRRGRGRMQDAPVCTDESRSTRAAREHSDDQLYGSVHDLEQAGLSPGVHKSHSNRSEFRDESSDSNDSDHDTNNNSSSSSSSSSIWGDHRTHSVARESFMTMPHRRLARAPYTVSPDTIHWMVSHYVACCERLHRWDDAVHAQSRLIELEVALGVNHIPAYLKLVELTRRTGNFERQLALYFFLFFMPEESLASEVRVRIAHGFAKCCYMLDNHRMGVVLMHAVQQVHGDYDPVVLVDYALSLKNLKVSDRVQLENYMDVQASVAAIGKVFRRAASMIVAQRVIDAADAAEAGARQPDDVVSGASSLHNGSRKVDQPSSSSPSIVNELSSLIALSRGAFFFHQNGFMHDAEQLYQAALSFADDANIRGHDDYAHELAILLTNYATLKAPSDAGLAQTLYERAAQLCPHHADVAEVVSDFYVQSGNYERGSGFMQRVMTHNPSMAHEMYIQLTRLGTGPAWDGLSAAAKLDVMGHLLGALGICASRLPRYDSPTTSDNLEERMNALDGLLIDGVATTPHSDVACLTNYITQTRRSHRGRLLNTLYRHAITRFPFDTAVLVNYATLCADRGFVTLARKYYAKAYGLADGDFSRTQCYANCLSSHFSHLPSWASQSGCGEVLYRDYVQRHPQSALAHTHYANYVAVALPTPCLVERHFEKALQLDPRAGTTCQLYAHFVWACADSQAAHEDGSIQSQIFDKAEQLMQRAVELEPANVTFLLQLGTFYSNRRDRFEEAIEVLYRAHKLSPYNADIVRQMCVVLECECARARGEDQRQPRVAAGAAQQGLTGSASSSSRLHFLIDSTRQSFERALMLDPRHRLTLEQFAHFAVSFLNDHVLAADLFKRIQRLDHRD